jgi:hypothetical protein
VESDYYCKKVMEAIDVIEAFELNFCIACAVKYLLRCWRKGDDGDSLRDLEKARAYIDREIKRRTSETDLEGLAKREAQK